MSRRASAAVCATSPTIAAAPFVERGLDQVRGGFVRQQLTRFLAIFAACSAFFFFYNIPAQWIGMHADPWPEDHMKRSYFTDGHLR